MRTLALIPGLLLCLGLSSQTSGLVKSVDLNRFSGKWFEIASYPAKFQQGCRCSTAEYEVVAGKKYIAVTNRCILIKRSGSRVAEAGARAYPKKGYNNAWLKVSFFWPFMGDYQVIGLSEDYDWVIVGHPQQKYLWILSRESYMPSQTYHEITQVISSKGYNVNRLVKTPQNCDELNE